MSTRTPSRGGPGTNQYQTKPRATPAATGAAAAISAVAAEDEDSERVAWAFSPERRQWEAAGFDATAFEWTAAGGTLKEAEEWASCWRDAGLSGTLAEWADWRTAGFDAQTSRMWRELAGISKPSDTELWTAAGLTPADVYAWQKVAGVRSAADVAEWQDTTPWYTAMSAQEWTDEWSKHRDSLDGLLDWARTGIDARTAADQAGIGQSPESVEAAWDAAGFHPGSRSQWSEEMEPQEAARWRDAGFSGSEAYACALWADQGVEPPEAFTWDREGFDPDRRSYWVDEGISDLTEVLDWEERGFSVDDAVDWHSRGYTPRQAQDRRDAGGATGS